MLISPVELIQRRRPGKARAADLASLRARFVAVGGSASARTDALRLIELKTELAAELRTVTSCASGETTPACGDAFVDGS